MALSKKELTTILEAKFSPLRDEIAHLKQELRDSISFLEMANIKYEEISKKLANLESENSKILSENQMLKKMIQELDARVRQLEKESNDMRQYTRRDCLEIRGVPFHKDENTNSIVKLIGHQMGVYIEDGEISISHRLSVSKNYKGNSIPGVIVKFVRRDVKEQYYKARSKMKDGLIPGVITTADATGALRTRLYGKQINVNELCVFCVTH